MDYKGIEVSPELMERAKACTSPEELLAMANKEGYEISDEELESISGGWECPVVGPVDGDAREDIDPSMAHPDYVNGTVDGGELD